MASCGRTDRIHPFPEPYRAALRRMVDAYHARFAGRLACVMVWGSLHRGEAVPPWSDCDLDAYVENPSPEDIAWARGEASRLRAEHGDAPSGLVPPRDVACLAIRGAPPDPQAVRADALRFRMRYDATLIAGRDLRLGLPPSPPSAERARAAAASVLHGLRGGCEGRGPADFPLPSRSERRMRALARLAVLGGAYLLMRRGRFRSFRCADVVPELAADEIPWRGFLERTAAHAILRTAAAAADVADYAASALAWAEHLEAALEAA